MEILMIAISGLLAATSMVLLFEFLTVAHLVPADILGTIGKKVIPQFNAHGNGKKILVGSHLGIGILFAFVYVSAWNYVGFSSLGELVTAGAITGFGHGIFVSMIVVNYLSELWDSGEKIAVFGFSIGLLEILAHVLYGVVLGICIALFQVL